MAFKIFYFVILACITTIFGKTEKNCPILNKMRLCSFEIPLESVVNLVKNNINVNDREICAEFGENFEAENGIFCERVGLCAFDINFSLEEWQETFGENLTLTTCQIFVNEGQANCGYIRRKFYDSGALKGELINVHTAKLFKNDTSLSDRRHLMTLWRKLLFITNLLH